MPVQIAAQQCNTRFGPVYLAAIAGALCYVTIPPDSAYDMIMWLEDRLPSVDLVGAGGALDAQANAIAAFLEDGTPIPPMPVHLLGTPFQRAVWQAVLEIPYGETRSYADIAREIGHPLAARAVGAANAANPLPFVVPCHRVVGADGTIKGYPGGIITRRLLLELEGWRG